MTAPAPPRRPAVFLDRDGTIIEDVGYLNEIERMVLFPWSIDAIRALNRAGFAVVVVTNQSGVARKYFADAFVASRERGSAVHDPIAVRDGAFVRSRNRAGGLEGGVTNGENIVLEVAFKPISTLMKPLPSADLRTGAPSPAHIERSDVCVVPAAGVVAEAMLALVLADALCEKFGNDSVDDICAAVERYRQRLRPIDAR